MATKEVLKPRAASEYELETIKYGRKLRQESPDIIDAQAKALVALASTLLTVYTGALTLFKIPDNFNSFIIGMGIEAHISLFRFLILTSPIALWLWSIKSSLDVYHPLEYEANLFSPGQIEGTLSKLIRSKQAKLNGAMKYFLLALTVSTLCIGATSIMYSEKPTSETEPQDVQFIIFSSSTPTFDSMSIAWYKTNMTTVPVKLLNESGPYITVQLEDNKIAKFNKTLITGIIYLGNQSYDLNKTNQSLHE